MITYRKEKARIISKILKKKKYIALYAKNSGFFSFFIFPVRAFSQEQAVCS